MNAQKHISSQFIVAFILLTISMITISCSNSNDTLVQMVKGSTLSGYPNKTIGEAVDNFFGNPKWSSGVSENGTEFVNAKGSIIYAEKEVTAVIQFTISKDRKTFNINALEFNEIPQNKLFIAALLMKIYDK